MALANASQLISKIDIKVLRSTDHGTSLIAIEFARPWAIACMLWRVFAGRFFALPMGSSQNHKLI